MSDKSAYWFRHDTTSGSGNAMRRTRRLFAKQHNGFGHCSDGYYWGVCEALREKDGLSLPFDEESMEDLCDQIGCKELAIFLSWFDMAIEAGLLVKKGDTFHSPGLNKAMRVWISKSKNGKEGAKARWKKAGAYIPTDQLPFDHILNETHAKHCLNDKNWMDVLCMQNKELINEKIFEKRMGEFLLHLKSERKQHETAKEFRSHFSNWLRKQKPYSTDGKLSYSLTKK